MSKDKVGLPKPGEPNEFDLPVKEVAKVAGPISVVATRPGFYKQSRIKEGDVFTIDNEKQLGTWMKKI